MRANQRGGVSVEENTRFCWIGHRSPLPFPDISG
jgi:hypothetical protein